MRSVENKAAPLDEPLDATLHRDPADDAVPPTRAAERAAVARPSASGSRYGSGATAFPVRRAARPILAHRFRRRFAHPTQQPYRTFFQATRARPGAEQLGGGRARAPLPTRARSAPTASGRTCHPLLPFADWDACRPALDRLGAVLVAGCRDSVAARQLGFVPTHGVGRGARDGARPGRRAPRVGFLLSPPYFPLDVGGRARRPTPRRGTSCGPRSFSRSAFASSASAIVPVSST